MRTTKEIQPDLVNAEFKSLLRFNFHARSEDFFFIVVVYVTLNAERLTLSDEYAKSRMEHTNMCNLPRGQFQIK